MYLKLDLTKDHFKQDKHFEITKKLKLINDNFTQDKSL